jgi:flagellin
MTVINTNIKSLVSQNALERNSRELGKAMEQLSTGKRINSAADDAAGLAISNAMTSQIRGLNQAIRNANDGISLLQVAEGAMIEQTNMLQRMRELAVQSANDTNSAEQRGYLDLEYQQLLTEINRIGTNTEWNGMKVLDGSFSGTDEVTGVANSGKFTFQVGANSAQVITNDIGNFRTTGSVSGTVSAAATGTPATSTVAQVSSVAVSGTFAVGDVVAINVSGVSVNYEVNATDGTTGASVGAALYSALTSAGVTGSTSTMKTASNITLANSSGTLTFTAASANATFDLAIQSGGQLANITGTSVTTKVNSSTAIAAVDVALRQISEGRAGLGATINRLTYAADNLTNVSLNTSASRSRILDTDYAKAASELSRTQIIQQAATAVLAQANVDQQSVLKLLQG